MVSRIPPASPAAIMLVKSESKTWGFFFIASASDAPPSTSARVSRMTRPKFLSSSWVPRISRHWTSGRPASIITENCRVKTARLFADTLFTLYAFFGALAACFSFTGLTFVTSTCSRRSAETTASIESASRSPLTVSPARVRPLYANVAMCPYLACVLRRAILTDLPCSHRARDAAGRDRTRQPGAGHDTHPAVDQVLQLFLVRRFLQGRLERHLPLLIKR